MSKWIENLFICKTRQKLSFWVRIHKYHFLQVFASTPQQSGAFVVTNGGVSAQAGLAVQAAAYQQILNNAACNVAAAQQSQPTATFMVRPFVILFKVLLSREKGRSKRRILWNFRPFQRGEKITVLFSVYEDWFLCQLRALGSQMKKFLYSPHLFKII